MLVDPVDRQQVDNADLKSLCNAIAAQYCGILLMLDEAHLLVQSLDLIQQLRHALRESSRYGIIFAGERGLNQMFTDPSAPFYLQARIIPVGNFMAKADIAECALLPLAESERPLMSPMTIDHLGRLSLGKPNQIRLICHSIYRRYLRWMVQITCHVTMADRGFVRLNAYAEQGIHSMHHDGRSRPRLLGEHSLWYTLQ
jgi:hypothetical protein